jgi:hypothetical protein
MRILHLVEPPAPGLAGALWRPAPYDAGVLACRAAIERTPELEHRVCLIGPTSAERRAGALGLHTTHRIAPPAGAVSLGWFGLESLVRDRGLPDAVQCWTRPLLRLARLALGNSVPCVGPPAEYPLPAAPASVDRDQLRRRLGLQAGEKAVLLLADPPSTADARRFVFMLGLIEVAGHRCAGVIPSGARHLVRGRRFARDANLGTNLILTDLPAWALAPACDCAVLHDAGDEPAVRSAPETAAAIARAAVGATLIRGLPVLSPAGAGTEALYDERAAPLCIAASAHTPDIAARLVRLFGDMDRLSDLAAHLQTRTRKLARADRTVPALVARWLHPQMSRGAAGGPAGLPLGARSGAVA